MFNKTILFIDFNHICMRCRFVQKDEDIEEFGYQYFKYLVLNNLFKAINKFKPTEVVLGIDGRKVWRKKVWKYYKVNRKLKREKDSMDWEEYYQVCDEFEDELNSTFPFKIVRTPYTEADDIAGILASWDALKDDKKVFVTSDTDYIQLLRFPNTTVYDQKQKKYLTAVDPKAFLIKKILQGDKKDYVPGVREQHHWKPEFMRYCVDLQGLASDEEAMKEKLEENEDYRNHLMVKYMREYGLKPSKVMGIGDKKASLILENDELKTLLEGENYKGEKYKERFKRNTILLDLSKQPEKVKALVREKYQSAEAGNCKNMMKYFVKNKFTKFIEDASIISMNLRGLVEG